MRFISLTLENFQAHKRITIDFDRSITVVTGQSDVGKSAIIRALRWICLNDFPGDEFIRHGTKEAVVALKVRHNKTTHEIIRKKGKENFYSLDGKEFKAFGNSVPADITALLNLNEVNFQAQHDSPYWFSESAGEVSRRLNAIIDLSVIDTALSNVATEVRRASDRVNISEERLTQAKKEYEELQPQEKRIEGFERLVECKDKLDKIQERIGLLDGLGRNAFARGREAEEWNERSRDGELLLDLASCARKADADFTALSEITADILHYRESAKPPPDFAAVDLAYDGWIELKGKWNDLDFLIVKIKSWEASLLDKQKFYEETENQFHKQIKGMKCPTCGKEI